jgi:hypothetical protein
MTIELFSTREIVINFSEFGMDPLFPRLWQFSFSRENNGQRSQGHEGFSGLGSMQLRT